ncbi:MAG: hypothetical protein KKA60_09100 [Proteobacteria bacterium]|nr:hypothetical protein [Pseudomonadota bacterium]
MDGKKDLEIANFTLSGWKAVAVAVALAVLFVGFRVFWVRSPGPEAAQEAQRYLMLESARTHMPSPGDLENMAPDELERRARDLLAFSLVRVEDMKIRGSRKDAVARVKVSVDGRTPPDGREIRYLRMERLVVGGWRVKGDASSLSWHLKLW